MRPYRLSYTDAQRRTCEAALLAAHTMTEAAFAARISFCQARAIRSELIASGAELPPVIRGGRYARAFEVGR